MLSEFARDLDDLDAPLREALANRPGKPLRLRIQPSILQANGTYKGWRSVSWSLEVDDMAEAKALQGAMEHFFRTTATCGPQAVEAALARSGIREGLCLVNAMHISASVFVNDDERGLHHDFGAWLEQLVPYDRARWHHNRTGEDNADSHIKRQVMGREVVVAVTDGKLDFGPWEQIFYGEFDGLRRKRVLVKILGE